MIVTRSYSAIDKIETAKQAKTHITVGWLAPIVCWTISGLVGWIGRRCVPENTDPQYIVYSIAGVFAIGGLGFALTRAIDSVILSRRYPGLWMHLIPLVIVAGFPLIGTLLLYILLVGKG